MWLAGLRTFFLEPRVDVENLSLARCFISIMVWVGIGIACFLIYKLFGQWIALASFACLAYSPFFLAQTRRVHTDALATTFILLTVLLFLLYCQNREHPHFLIFSGVVYGFALLSKSYALILLLWVPLCLFLFRKRENSGSRVFLESLTAGVCFLNCATLTVLFLWPVFWTSLFGLMAFCLFGFTYFLCRETMKNGRPPLSFLIAAIAGLGLVGVCTIHTIWRVFDRLHWAITIPHGIEHFFLGKVVDDPGWLFYLVVLTLKSTPLMLPLAIVGCLLLWKQRKDSEETARHFKTGLALFICVILFTVCLSATSKKLSRYL